MAEGALSRVRKIHGRADLGLQVPGLVDADLGGKLLIALGGLSKAVERLENQQRVRDALIPVPVDFAGGAASPATGSLLLKVNPGGPPAGYTWHVRRVTVTGSAASGTPGGIIQLFMGMNPTTAASGDYGATLRDQSSTAFPVSGFYDDYQMTVTFPNQLYVIILTPTASTQYSISGTAKMTKDHGPGGIDYMQ